MTLEETKSTPKRGSREETSEGIATLTVPSGRLSEKLQLNRIKTIIKQNLDKFIKIVLRKLFNFKNKSNFEFNFYLSILFLFLKSLVLLMI